MSASAVAAYGGAAARLHRLIRHRDALRSGFERAWRRLPKHDAAALEDWAAAALELIEVNAGPACQLAFWNAAAGGASLRLQAASGRGAAAVCRHAGARAALACLEALPSVMGAAGQDEALRRWWQGLERLAREAADCVAPAVRHAEKLLADRSGRVFADFVAAGLKAYAKDPARRRAFFSLEDPWARALLARRPNVPGFEALSRLLSAYSRAVWGDVATWRAGPSDSLQPRASLAGRVVLLPPSVATDTEAAARRLYLATAAHASAHLAQPPVRHAAGPLKPLQIALVTLIEDARIEALAMRRFPGLRRLWAPFHAAPPDGPRTAANLLARLSRALFDPAHADPDGFVAKARALFAEEAARDLGDPALSLRIGRVLGHDLGQMRVQFNWRDYVIEPEYRDDGHHLWEPPDEPSQALDLQVQAARGRNDAAGGSGGEGAGRARDAAADDRGAVIATYPEWDAAAGVERPDWTVLREVPARPADPAPLRAAVEAQAALRRQIAGLVRAAAIGRPVRLKRQPDGDDLDMDAALDAMVALRGDLTPETRVFRVTRPRSRDLATIIMLDTSASMAARLPDGRSVLDVQRLAVSLLGEALEQRSDAFKLCAFASNGREDVRMTDIKTFGERFDAAALSRLAGLRPGLSTRLGAALRHARAEFESPRAWRRLLLVLTDGEPSDIDVAHGRELVVDARRAALGLKQAGIDVFGVVLDPEGVGSAAQVFGPSNTIAVRDLAELPARLSGLYFRLARR
jgi:nitric oxide reductase NorD protein